MRVSIVVPVFNDAAALPELIERSSRALQDKGWQVEFILVDDGSPDTVWSSLTEVRRAHRQENITLVRLRENFGQNLATLCGIRLSKHEYVVTMDADLQHPPEEIPRLLGHLTSNGLGLAYGTSLKGHPVARQIPSRLLKALINLTVPGGVDASSFRAMTRATANALMERVESRNLLVDVALYRAASRAGTLATSHDERRHGVSSYSWMRLLLLAGAILVQSGALFKLAVAASLVMVVPGLYFALEDGSSAFLALSLLPVALASLIVAVSLRVASRRPFSAACVREVLQ